jgi:hypothetical protein
MVVLIKEMSMVKDMAAISPPLAVTSMNFLGFPIADWAALLSILWVITLIGFKISEVWTNRKVKNKIK